MTDINTNLQLFLKKLNQLGFNTEKLEADYGDKLLKATFTHLGDTGLSYEGSLLQTVLYKLTPYAIRLNEMLPEEIRANKDVLIKICLLHQIAKAVRYIPNDNEWEVKNRNMPFKFNGNNPAIRCGLHSLSIACECGIPFTAEETEAMTINDRDLSDDQARYYSSILSSIIRQANEMVYLEATNINKVKKEKKDGE